MSAKPNYFKLGLFILISLFLLLAGIILFGSGLLGQKNIYFETYFKDSVSGLSVGAPVQDNGVQIGTVQKQVAYGPTNEIQILPLFGGQASGCHHKMQELWGEAILYFSRDVHEWAPCVPIIAAPYITRNTGWFTRWWGHARLCAWSRACMGLRLRFSMPPDWI